MSVKQLIFGLLVSLVCAAPFGLPAYAAGPRLVRPSVTDSAIKAFDDPHVVFAPPTQGAPLVIFLPGTGGHPENAMTLMQVIAGQGDAVIGLEYDDDPAVVQVCPHNPSPDCSAQFRQMRLYGTGSSTQVSNPVAESIVARLTSLLTRLSAEYPKEGWSLYLKDGAPDWSRITVSGLSQGAGMAAYLAKDTAVARVVLFSSPWDFYTPGPVLAPWISGPSATPPDRWYGAYNKREKTADLLARSYAALNIPADHILVFDLDLPANVDPSKSPNPYHATGIHDLRYMSQWRFLYGHASP